MLTDYFFVIQKVEDGPMRVRAVCETVEKAEGKMEAFIKLHPSKEFYISRGFPGAQDSSVDG